MLCAANFEKITLRNLSVRINNRYFPLPCYEFLTNRDLPVNLPVNLLADLPVNLLADLLNGKHMKLILFVAMVSKFDEVFKPQSDIIICEMANCIRYRSHHFSSL